MNKYKCPLCKKTVERASSKKWIKSYCSGTGKNTRLILITDYTFTMPKPKATLEQVRELIAAKFPIPEDEVLFVGVRGYYKDSLGIKGKNDIGIYDDAIFIIHRDECHAFNANCDASIHNYGAARLKEGVWRVYKFDTHRGRKSQYPAICQRAGDVIVTRYGRVGEHVGNFGINIHSGGLRGTNSQGCQTIIKTQWSEFYATAEALCKKVYGESFKDVVYTYILIDA